MKDPRLIVSLVVALILGSLLYAEKQHSQRLEGEMATSRAEALGAKTRTDAELQDLERQIANLKGVISQFEERGRQAASHPLDEGAAEDATKPPGGVVGGAESGGKERTGFTKMMAKMFTDPEMKKMMRAQQGMGIQMMYRDLAKELGLSAEEAKQINELLIDRQMARAGSGMKMLGGDAEGAVEAEGVSGEEYDKQLENLLGKDRFAQFNDYERSMGDRMQMTQYKQAFEANGVALSDKQSKGLLEIMKTERVKAPPSPLDPASGDVAAAMEVMQSEEGLNQLMKSQEDLNRRVLSQARNVLNPDQMVQFQQIQQQQLDMQKMGMKMGREMFKSQK